MLTKGPIKTILPNGVIALDISQKPENMSVQEFINKYK